MLHDKHLLLDRCFAIKIHLDFIYSPTHFHERERKLKIKSLQSPTNLLADYAQIRNLIFWPLDSNNRL